MNRQQALDKVYVSYKINCVADISATASTFDVEMKLSCEWEDSKLVGRTTGEIISYSHETGLFDPEIQITNKNDLRIVSADTTLTNSSIGEAKRCLEIKGVICLLYMDLRYFPFDCHNLQINFSPGQCTSKGFHFIPVGTGELTMDASSIAQWKCLGHCMTSEGENLCWHSTEPASLVVNLMVTRRQSPWFLVLAFMPTLMFLLVSWMTFDFTGDGQKDRLDVSTAVLLCSISHKYYVSKDAPKLASYTILDGYINTSIVLQVATFAFHVTRAFGKTKVDFFSTFSTVATQIIFALIVFEWLFVRVCNHDSALKEWIKNAQLVAQLNVSRESVLRNAKAENDDEGVYKPASRGPRRNSILSRILRLVSSKLAEGLDDEIATSRSFPNFGESLQSQHHIPERQGESKIRQQLDDFDETRRSIGAASQAGDADSVNDTSMRVIQGQSLRKESTRSTRTDAFGDTAGEDLDYVIVEAESNLTEDSFDISFVGPNQSQEFCTEQLSSDANASADDDQDCSNITEDMFVPSLRRSRGESEDTPTHISPPS